MKRIAGAGLIALIALTSSALAAAVDGKRPAAAATPPAGLASCAQSKKLPAPSGTSGACTGDGFKVVVDHAGKDRLVALYARKGKDWHFCRAGSA